MRCSIYMKWIFYSTIFLLVFCSCETRPSEEDLLREYIESIYAGNIRNKSFVFVSEYDCIECVQRINRYVEAEVKLNSRLLFYGEYLKLQKFGNSEIETVLDLQTQISWRTTKCIEVYSVLGNISGPYVVSFDLVGDMEV